jgi:cytoskeletal protein CcmA (bactofilin family)
MLRIGKNANDNEQADKHDVSGHAAASRTTPPSPAYQAADTQTRPTPDVPGSSRALTESESLARDIKEGSLSGFVGSGTAFTGEATFKAMMRVDGHLSGRITSSSGTLVVGTNGKVDANIEVAVAQVHGTVNGDIIATQRLELGRSAKVNGNIQAPSLIIEQGAVFEGSCKMTQAQPAVAAADKKKNTYTSRDDQVLDATKIKSVGAGEGGKASDITSVSEIAS